MDFTFQLLLDFDCMCIFVSFYWLFGQVRSKILIGWYLIKISSSFSPNVDFTIALLPAGIVPMVVMCGYLINVDNIPAYVVPVRWLSWYTHLNELLQANQWGGVSVDELCIVRDDQPTTPFNYTHFIIPTRGPCHLELRFRLL